MEAIANEIIPSEDIDDQVAELYINTNLTLREISEELGVTYSRVCSRVSYLLKRGAINGRRGRPTP